MGFLSGLKKNMPAKVEEPEGILSSDAEGRETSDADAEALTKKKKPAKKTPEEKAAAKAAKAAAKAEKQAAEAAAKAAEAAESEPAPTEERKTRKAANSASGGFTLYVDCAPMKGAEYSTMEELLYPIIEDSGGQAEFWALGFADQKNAINTMAKEIAKTGQDIVVRSSAPFSADVTPVLAIIAARVITRLG